MTVQRALRRALRPLLGRDRPAWRYLPSPALRLRAFHDPLDCLVHSLLVSRGRVRFVEIGANDGRTGDRLWAFRRYPGWSGILVEPQRASFERLAENYAPWIDRFTLVNAAVAPTRGVRPFYHFEEGDETPLHTDQLGSLHAPLVQLHRERLGVANARPVAVSEVRCVTMADLLEGSGVVNLVAIDAEGSDAAIVAQLDLAAHPPEMVVFEHVHLSEEERAATRRRLEESGYLTLLAGQDTLCVAGEALRETPRLRAAWALIGGARATV